MTRVPRTPRTVAGTPPSVPGRPPQISPSPAPTAQPIASRCAGPVQARAGERARASEGPGRTQKRPGAATPGGCIMCEDHGGGGGGDDLGYGGDAAAAPRRPCSPRCPWGPHVLMRHLPAGCGRPTRSGEAAIRSLGVSAHPEPTSAAVARAPSGHPVPRSLRACGDHPAPDGALSREGHSLSTSAACLTTLGWAAALGAPPAGTGGRGRVAHQGSGKPVPQRHLSEPSTSRQRAVRGRRCWGATGGEAGDAGRPQNLSSCCAGSVTTARQEPGCGQCRELRGAPGHTRPHQAWGLLQRESRRGKSAAGGPSPWSTKHQPTAGLGGSGCLLGRAAPRPCPPPNPEVESQPEN